MQGNPIFMEEAITLATKNISLGNGGSFGAVIARDGKIVATGVNPVCRIPTINLLREQAISNFEAWRKCAGRIDY
jgi:deoxycytidylate deaminase